jgi:hypothetical protein
VNSDTLLRSIVGRIPVPAVPLREARNVHVNA